MIEGRVSSIYWLAVGLFLAVYALRTIYLGSRKISTGQYLRDRADDNNLSVASKLHREAKNLGAFVQADVDTDAYSALGGLWLLGAGGMMFMIGILEFWSEPTAADIQAATASFQNVLLDAQSSRDNFDVFVATKIREGSLYHGSIVKDPVFEARKNNPIAADSFANWDGYLTWNELDPTSETLKLRRCHVSVRRSSKSGWSVNGIYPCRGLTTVPRTP